MSRWTPDPSFYPSPKLAMEAPPETLAYDALLEPDQASRPDALGDPSRAHEHYAVGIALLEGQGPSRYLANAYRRQAALFEIEYRTKDALEVLRRAFAVQRRVERAVVSAA